MTDFGLPVDKISHFGTCYIYTHIMHTAIHFNIILCALGILAISILKESIDCNAGGNFSIADVLANFCGFGAYFAIAYTAGNM